MKRFLCGALCALLFWSCDKPAAQTDAKPAAPEPQQSAAPALVQVQETFVTESREEENVDSIGIYHGDPHLAVVTAKATHQVVVFNALTGERLQVVGKAGTEPGNFQRPNGIQVIDDLMLVVERDNHRVQVLSMPDMKPLGMIGVADLIRPYGLSCVKDQEGYHLYVTDDYELAEGEPIPSDFYTKRIKQFRFTVKDGNVDAKLVRTFGEAEGDGQLFKVESILVDMDHKRLLIAVEKGAAPGIKIYNLDGVYTGQLDTSAFKGEPEGLALYRHEGRAYVVTTDQQDAVTVFHLYDQESLNHKASFRGVKTANTDGICVSSQKLEGYPEGILLAIHDDQALSGFSWAAIREALSL